MIIKIYWHSTDGGMCEDINPDDNSWVRYPDHLSQLAALQEELETAQCSLRNWKSGSEVLKQRLADVERRNGELVEVLKMARGYVHIEGTDEEAESIDAALTKPEEAKS